jgi:NTP pyrophosphatase (non-canonical NTP hydrolase)
VDTDAVLAKVMLVVTELAEAVEEARVDQWIEHRREGDTEKPEGFVTELADAVIRIFHIAGLLGLDLETAIQNKMAYNETRSHRHGGKKA